MAFLRLHLAACVAVVVLASCGGSIDDDLPFAFSATLTGAQEVPPTASTGSGVGLVTVDPDGRALTASVVTTGVVDTDAHIHLAIPGTVGPVAFPLTKAAGTTVWTARAPLTDPQFAALRDGNYYFNVHSPSFPNGEIRGQITWSMPTPEQLNRLEQVREQSATVELQLRQVQEILEADDWRFTGIGLGFTLGF
ncbi:CHRD domain-containing protein [Noviherbaspirillum sp. ST9]|uniref:CHRD domain-containing protein n=1 Tax=Noviherbaspirillum sp. ST9 TaxID=3401606 RepID=UPI003B58891D